MRKKRPETIRIGNLDRTLRMIENMVGEVVSEDDKAGAELVIRLLRKEYGIEVEEERK